MPPWARRRLRRAELRECRRLPGCAGLGSPGCQCQAAMIRPMTADPGGGHRGQVVIRLTRIASSRLVRCGPAPARPPASRPARVVLPLLLHAGRGREQRADDPRAEPVLAPRGRSLGPGERHPGEPALLVTWTVRVKRADDDAVPRRHAGRAGPRRASRRIIAAGHWHLDGWKAPDTHGGSSTQARRPLIQAVWSSPSSTPQPGTSGQPPSRRRARNGRRSRRGDDHRTHRTSRQSRPERLNGKLSGWPRKFVGGCHAASCRGLS